MMFKLSSFGPALRAFSGAMMLLALFQLSAAAQSAGGKKVYDIIKSFQLTGGSATVNNLTLKRDRGTMTFTGTFYFTPPMQGFVTGAVFIGAGKFRAEVPPSEFEKDNVRRLLDADVVESDFRTAVLRFSDDTFSIIGKGAQPGAAAPEEAVKLAADHEPRALRESGINYSARLAQSLLNNEPGVFVATFDGGKRGRFTFLVDPMTRIPTTAFGINAGEAVLVYEYQRAMFSDEVWLAAYSEADYQRGVGQYSNLFDLVDVTGYKMTVDLTSPKERIAVKSAIRMVARFPGLQAINFNLGENLVDFEDQRAKKQIKVKSVMSGGQPLAFAQDEREGGFTVFLDKPTKAGEELEIEVDAAGDFIRQPTNIDHAHYPRSNSAWYPRHGYLDRSTFEMKFLHTKKYKIAAVGTRTLEEAVPEGKDLMQTVYSMKDNVALVTFAMAPWERHVEEIKWDKGGKPIPLEFSSMPGAYASIKEDFILAELNNSVRFFHALFGDYPYEKFGASFHPYGFGQGFATMLMIPATDRASKYTYAFVSHETAHQWWGNIVAWRSYRDQWLSEGFAEYSGMLYTSFRENPKAAQSLIDQARRIIKDPPVTTTGIGKGKVNDLGPIILGHRLNTSKSAGAYQDLIYQKGALVLRMMHFLFSNPSDGTDQAFFDMMKDFVNRYRDKEASTDDFRVVANEHFVKTPIAKKYNIRDLNWFFEQWVYQTNMPSYRLEYEIKEGSGGGVEVVGNVIQENAGEKWFMPMPIVFRFGGDKTAKGTVAAYGPKQSFKIPLPQRPAKVELDPDKWILSEKTETK
jgi:hypothetical protein